MSGYTGTLTEVLYASAAAGNNLATFTTEAVMYSSTQPECVIPAGFFDPTYAFNKTLRVTCRGIYSTTSTPTFTVGLRLGSAANATSGQILGTSVAITSPTTVTNLVWELECDVTASAVPLLGSSHNQTTVVTYGIVSNLAGTAGANVGFTMGSAIGTQTPTTALTITQTDIALYLVPTITCGTSSASNKWQMLQMVVQGMN